MEWKTTEELYAELLDMRVKIAETLSKASEQEAIGRKANELASTLYADERWMSRDLRELEKELAKRAGREN